MSCDPRPQMVALEPPFLTRKYFMLSPTWEQGERRGRQRDYIVICNHKEFWKLSKANRAAYHPKVIPAAAQGRDPGRICAIQHPFHLVPLGRPHAGVDQRLLLLDPVHDVHLRDDGPRGQLLAARGLGVELALATVGLDDGPDRREADIRPLVQPGCRVRRAFPGEYRLLASTPGT